MRWRAPWRRAAFTTRSATSLRSIQSRRSSSAPASMRVIAEVIPDHLVEVLGFFLDLAEQILFRRWIQLVAELDQAAGGTQDR